MIFSISRIANELKPHLTTALVEVLKAREKHGDQKHLGLISPRTPDGFYGKIAENYKAACDNAGEGCTWDLILLEEVFEALEALQNGDLAAGQAELGQVAAMVLSISELVATRLADSNTLEVGSGTCTSTAPAQGSTPTPAAKLA